MPGHAGEASRFAQADGRDGEDIVARVWSAGEHYGHVGMAATSCWQARVGERVHFGGCGNWFGLCRGGSKVARVHMCGNVSTRSDLCHYRRNEPCARVSNNEGARRCRQSGVRSACRPNERFDGVTKVSSGRITSVCYGRSRSVTAGTARCRWKLDGRTRSRDGIPGPELLAPERTGSTSDRLGHLEEGNRPLADDDRRRGASTNLQHNVTRGRSTERSDRPHGRENL